MILIEHAICLLASRPETCILNEWSTIFFAYLAGTSGTKMLLDGSGFRGGQLTMAVARGCLDPLHLHLGPPPGVVDAPLEVVDRFLGWEKRDNF